MVSLLLSRLTGCLPPISRVLAVGAAAIQLSSAEEVVDYAVQASATIQTDPATITLSWPVDPDATAYLVSRKAPEDSAWGLLAALDGDVASYADSVVAIGETYEYRIKKKGLVTGYGHLLAGIEAPLVESRGKVILVVDDTQTAALASELTRLELDLAGDGWTVLRHDVPRMVVNPADTDPGVGAARAAELASVKALIQADYVADPENVRAVLLLGRVPVPYSGDLYPDGHTNHRGAWPADGYYGDMDGNWTDTSVNKTGASDPRNHNVPGDGKFDASILPSAVELGVGRIDFANMPDFVESETELLRRYLDKNHAFRHKVFTAARRGLIDDHLGLNLGNAPASNGWRNFAAFFGSNNSVAADWMTTLSTESYLWGYGCGGGSFTTCSGVVSTSQLSSTDPRVVFSMFLGSYFGDWDSSNNLLRAAIATPGYTLTSVWAGRPSYFFHHMGLGETIGHSTRITQSLGGLLYFGGGYYRFASTGLMGDPTLRMHVVAPPSGLAASPEPGGLRLSWTPSPDTVLGYHVYRAPSEAGPFTRLNAAVVPGTEFVDPAPTAAIYMVRAVTLEVSGSGSYYNASQGVFITATGVETYDTWAVRHGVSSPEGNEDGDSFVNLLEYALGLDPHFNDSAVTPKPIAASESGVEVTMPAIAAGDLAVFVEASDDLGAWTNLATRTGNGLWVPAEGVVITSETLPESRVRWTFAPPWTGDRLFTRFGATLVSP